MLIAEHAARRSDDNGDAAGCADGTTASGNWPGRDGATGAAMQSARAVGVTASICERIRCVKRNMRSRAAKKIISSVFRVGDEEGDLRSTGRGRVPGVRSPVSGGS